MCFSVLSVVITFRYKLFLNLVIHVFAAAHTQCVQGVTGAFLRQQQLCRSSNDWHRFQNHLINSTVLT